MAEFVPHAFFPGDTVFVMPHVRRKHSHGPDGLARSLVVSIRAISEPPFFWYCVRHVLNNPHDVIEVTSHWFEAKFVQAPRPILGDWRRTDLPEELGRIRVGSDVLIRDRNDPEASTGASRTLYRVCEMTLKIDKVGVTSFGSELFLRQLMHSKHELTECIVVDRLGNSRRVALLDLVLSVTGEVVAKHSWSPLVDIPT